MCTLRFLQCHVFVHEHLYLHYLRRTVRHFEQSHSSPHEGTNSGIKNHSAPVTPVMGLDVSSSTLNLQANLKAAQLDACLHAEFSNTNKRWSDLPTSPYLLSFGEALMVSETNLSEHKTSHRVGASVFQTHHTPSPDAPVPEENLELPQEPRKKGKKKKRKRKSTILHMSLCHCFAVFVPSTSLTTAS